MIMKNFLNTNTCFDFSEYKSNCFDLTIKKVICKMGDEFKGI